MAATEYILSYILAINSTTMRNKMLMSTDIVRIKLTITGATNEKHNKCF